jgi:hypothetical protein
MASIGDAIIITAILAYTFFTESTEGQQIINAIVGCPQVCSTDEGEVK